MTEHRSGRPRRPARPVPAPAPAEEAPRRRPPTHEKRPPWLAPRRLSEWQVTSCGCDDCKEACLNSPGWFVPEELERLADYLNLTLEALFKKHLAVSTTELPDGSKRHGIMPHKLRDHKRPGVLWTLPEVAEPGRCVFYDHGRCTIYPVRPFECARAFHSHRKELKTLRQQVVERWTREALRVYEAWVGQRLFPKHVPAGAGERGHPDHRRGRPRDEAPSGNRRGDQPEARRADEPRPHGARGPGTQRPGRPDRPDRPGGHPGGRGRPGGSGGAGEPGNRRGRGLRPDHEGTPEAHPDFAEEPRGARRRGPDDDGGFSHVPRPPRPPRPGGGGGGPRPGGGGGGPRPGGGGGRRGGRPRGGRGPGRPSGAGND